MIDVKIEGLDKIERLTIDGDCETLEVNVVLAIRYIYAMIYKADKKAARVFRDDLTMMLVHSPSLVWKKDDSFPCAIMMPMEGKDGEERLDTADADMP